MSSCSFSKALRALSDISSSAFGIQNMATNPSTSFLVKMAAACQNGVTATQRTISNILSEAESGEEAINKIVTYAGGDIVMGLQAQWDDYNKQLQSVVKQGINDLEQASGYDELVRVSEDMTSLVSSGSDFVNCIVNDAVSDANRISDLVNNINGDIHTAENNIKKYTSGDFWVKKIKSSIKKALTDDVKSVIGDIKDAIKPFTDDETSIESSVTQIKNGLKKVRSLSTDFSSLLSSATSSKNPVISSKDTISLLKKAGVLDVVKQSLPMLATSSARQPDKYQTSDEYTATSVSSVSGKDKAQDFQKMLTQQASKIKRVVEAQIS